MVPAALRLDVAPAHIVDGVAEAVKPIGFNTETIPEEAVLEHPFAFVPITVYVVVEAGAAVTEGPVVADNPVAGDQAYVTAPFANRFTGVPPGLQMTPIVGLMLTLGKEFTVIGKLETH